MPPMLTRAWRLFDLDCRPDLVDAHLGTLTTETPGLRMPGAVDGFEITVRAVTRQVISLAQAWHIPSRMTTAYGVPLQQLHEGLLAAFLSAAVLTSTDTQVLFTQTGL